MAIGDITALTIITFAPPTELTLLRSRISEFGYSAQVIPGEAWFNDNYSSVAKSSLLLLKNSNKHSLDWRKIVRKAQSYVTAALIDRYHPFWDHNNYNFSDTLQWPCRRSDLLACINRALSRRYRYSDYTEFRQRCLRLNLIGNSPAFLSCLEQIQHISRCDAPVLIGGETGTGKELAARAIHYLGHRGKGPFVPVNCGAIPDSLLENELFGHEKGAYTDAKGQRMGFIGEANGGSLFLDEIDALSFRAQVALLRYLQDKKFKPLGGRSGVSSDTRIIAACNADLEEAVRVGAFRQDLFFRLNVLSLKLPSLRDRVSDIPVLVDHFLDQASLAYNKPKRDWDTTTVEWMLQHKWPGNVRELENFVHRAVLMSPGSLLGMEQQSNVDRSLSTVPFEKNFNLAKKLAIQNFEKNYLSQLMEQANGNVTHAAEICGKERRALGKLLKKYKIDKDQYKGQ